ncbi:MAG: sacsin N-terminal ATP-binding-like domain-containing protein [Mycobacteriales bacterium]
MRTADPFGTVAIRQRVLAGWAAAPARFREDANAEEDYALGGYRDRLVVELAQNAADAAARAGRPGVLRLTVEAGVLLAANTGAPLDSDGVASLATLRASAKREEEGATVGRFGVGFAAVLAVTDEPELVSTSGAVRFSRRESAGLVAARPELAAEVGRRRGHVPVLRLPFESAGTPPAGFTTEVRLPLRPGTAESVAAQLADLDATLLLALPGLERIELADATLSAAVDGDDVVLADRSGSRRWRVRRAGGTVPAGLLAGRPTEERDRDAWSLTWAVPVDVAGGPQPLGAGVVHAPTPTDEPISLPARLIATLPLEPTRRRLAPGPLADFVLDLAGREYAALLNSVAGGPAVLGLVPEPALVGSPHDAALAATALAALRRARILPTVDGALVAPPDAVALDVVSPPLVAALRDAVGGLLPAEWSARGHERALRRLGARRLTLGEVVELLAALDRPPAWWHDIYTALDGLAEPGELAGLPVPLSDGRTVVGARGVLLPETEPPVTLPALGLRVAALAASHPLLERLGAVPASPGTVLADARVRDAVQGSFDLDDPEPVMRAVLDLVAAAGPAATENSWLAEIALPGTDGEWHPAAELVLPDSALSRVLARDAPFAAPAGWLRETWGDGVLADAGVLRDFAVLRVDEAELDPDADVDLDGYDAWAEATLDRLPDSDLPPRVEPLAAVRDLEFVADWPAALDLLAAERRRNVVEEPVIVHAGGRDVAVPSYTRWWLAGHPVLDGRRPRECRLPDAADLEGVYDVAPGPHAALAGAWAGLDAVLADPAAAADLLDRLGGGDRRCSAVVARDVYSPLAAALAAGPLPSP